MVNIVIDGRHYQVPDEVAKWVAQCNEDTRTARYSLTKVTNAVKHMRDKQNGYFAMRTQDNLRASKAAESRVDELLKIVEAGRDITPDTLRSAAIQNELFR